MHINLNGLQGWSWREKEWTNTLMWVALKTRITCMHDFCLLSSYILSIILIGHELPDMTTFLVAHTRCTVSVLDSATMQQIYALWVSPIWWETHLTLLPKSHHLISTICLSLIMLLAYNVVHVCFYETDWSAAVCVKNLHMDEVPVPLRVRWLSIVCVLTFTLMAYQASVDTNFLMRDVVMPEYPCTGIVVWFSGVWQSFIVD
jgi:hypothetical protein